MSVVLPESQRRFALSVVETLRRKGFESYWAGGCVRDELLGRTPHDYDVATAATPEVVRDLFGRRRTLAIGAAFGVVTVLGPRDAGPIEVATFRKDATYRDGRHPEGVTFSSAEEDAQRRDFTINGLFLDPVAGEVIDFVGGRADLDARLLRAIGRPKERFGEDKLRLLRAVRFAAEFDFAIEPETRAAIQLMARQIDVVSAERIAGEMCRMLVGPGRVRAARLLVDTSLARAVLPEIVAEDSSERLERALAVLERLDAPSFPLALAALVGRGVDAPGAERLCRRWRLSNRITDRTAWLVAQQDALAGAVDQPWSVLQRVLVSPGIEALLRLVEARAAADGGVSEDAAYCRQVLARPRDELDPPPLVSGDDLARHGIPPGPAYARLLERVRAAQLDGQVQSRDEALGLVDRLTEDKGLGIRD
ncbi:MAG: CCA tRNA nucleotidyltransferase [Pirellulales bacterium]|nr:CCA tRNA nucleotidyltransferase [Pirellulales bacterium]